VLLVCRNDLQSDAAADAATQVVDLSLQATAARALRVDTGYLLWSSRGSRVVYEGAIAVRGGAATRIAGIIETTSSVA
jgi:hypothetical protein